MNKDIPSIHAAAGQRGMTLIELLVGLMLSSILMFGALQFYMVSARNARDNQVRVAAFLQAQAVVQNVGFELRILGNGVPFDQANFQIGESTLSDPTVTRPVDVDNTTATKIAFRLNETGDVLLVTQDFHPTISREVFLTDVNSLGVNDPIYLSNSVISGDDGLYGIIEAVNTGSKSVTIAAGYISSPGTNFSKGSVLEEVPMITYNYDPVFKEITRDSGFGTVTIAQNATMSLDYLDSSGTSLSLPLSEADLVNNLRAIAVTVTIESDTNLVATGEPYVAEVTQTFGLRNLNYLF